MCNIHFKCAGGNSVRTSTVPDGLDAECATCVDIRGQTDVTAVMNTDVDGESSSRHQTLTLSVDTNTSPPPAAVKLSVEPQVSLCPSPMPEARRSTNSRELMKRRVMNQTLVIIGAFFVCWTPYVFIASWYVIDPSSASRLSASYNDYLFMFAVSNSVVNPFVYSYNIK